MKLSGRKSAAGHLGWTAAVVAAAILAAGALQGCVSQAKARADAQAAYAAGQREALANVGGAQNQGPLVTVVGNVKTPVLAWNPYLTLARAIVLADFQGPTEPAEIFICRQGRAIRYTAEELLKGQDVPLQPGDVVQLGRR